MAVSKNSISCPPSVTKTWEQLNEPPRYPGPVGEGGGEMLDDDVDDGRDCCISML